jgi:hypothetical protein
MAGTKRPVYGAADQGSESPVRLSSLAISASAEDLAFLESRFREANWRLYVAGTLRWTPSVGQKNGCP